MAPAVVVRNRRQVEAAFAAAGKEAAKLSRAADRQLAEPVRQDAEQLARANITRIGPTWSRMRVGVTRTTVYVAPKERGVNGRGDDRRRRPNLANRLMPEMEQALERHRGDIEAGYERKLDLIADHFNR